MQRLPAPSRCWERRANRVPLTRNRWQRKLMKPATPDESSPYSQKSFSSNDAYTIAQVLRGLPGNPIRVFTKLFSELPGLPRPQTPNSRRLCRQKSILGWRLCRNVIWFTPFMTGRLAFRGFEAARAFGCRFFELSWRLPTQTRRIGNNHRA